MSTFVYILCVCLRSYLWRGRGRGRERERERERRYDVAHNPFDLHAWPINYSIMKSTASYRSIYISTLRLVAHVVYIYAVVVTCAHAPINWIVCGKVTCNFKPKKKSVCATCKFFLIQIFYKIWNVRNSKKSALD